MNSLHDFLVAALAIIGLNAPGLAVGVYISTHLDISLSMLVGFAAWFMITMSLLVLYDRFSHKE